MLPMCCRRSSSSGVMQCSVPALPEHVCCSVAAIPLAHCAAEEMKSAPCRRARRHAVHADISELNLSKGMSIRFPEGKDKLLVFEITMKPDDGVYRWSASLHCPALHILLTVMHAHQLLPVQGTQLCICAPLVLAVH